MSATPRTDALAVHILNKNIHSAPGRYSSDKASGMESLAKTLERELTALNKRIAELEQVSASDAKGSPGVGSDEHEWFIAHDGDWNPFHMSLYWTCGDNRRHYIEADSVIEAVRAAMAKEAQS